MSQEPFKRKRAKHTRSRLGCSVCRTRRVRCDQTRPACTRCTSTGRQCDGYPQSLAGQSPCDDERYPANPPRLGLIPSGSVKSTQAEGQLFDFFRRKTSFELAGPLQDDFWTRLVLQVSHREDCVRHMVVALSSLHQQSTETAHRTVRHYALALRSLNHHIISNEGANLDVTLLCTILCVTFECLRGNHHGAEVHLKAGMQVLEQWYAAFRRPGRSPRTSFSSPSGHMIRSTLSPAYTRLYLQAMSVLTDHSLSLPPPPREAQANQPFSSLLEARDGLYGIVCHAFFFHQASEEDNEMKRGHRKVHRVRHQPLSTAQALSQWSMSLEDLYDRNPYLKDQPGAKSLQIWLMTLSIMLSVKDADKETDYDRFTPSFTGIVDFAEELHQEQSYVFCSEISFVAILYFVALKCRHSTIRGRAISLLSTTQRREGIWHSMGTAQMCRETLHMEEKAESGLRGYDMVLGETITLGH